MPQPILRLNRNSALYLSHPPINGLMTLPLSVLPGHLRGWYLVDVGLPLAAAALTTPLTRGMLVQRLFGGAHRKAEA
jgi:hypothetical protein